MNIPLPLNVPLLEVAKHKARGLRRVFDRRALRMSIDRLHNVALEHECHGVQPGDEIYARLYNQARIFSDQYRRDWGGDVADLHVFLPSLEHLRRLAGHSDMKV